MPEREAVNTALPPPGRAVSYVYFAHLVSTCDGVGVALHQLTVRDRF